MASKIIPAKEVLICDGCGQQGEKMQSGPFHFGGVHIRKAENWGMGYGGDVGGVTLDFDFCSACWNTMLDSVRKPKERGR